jgi:single-strand DNA-binding protein
VTAAILSAGIQAPTERNTMSDQITVTGLVATEPRHITTQEGLAVTSFRLASLQRRWNSHTNQWRDDETNWYSVAAFRILATNAAASIQKGHRVIVSGRLKVRQWDAGERSGVSIDIEADAIGHDLVWGQSQFERNKTPEADQSDAAADETDETDDSDAF